MDYSRDPDFCEWWQLYPNKKAKPLALRAWIKADRLSQHDMLTILQDQINNETQWKRGYIPHPSTYLNQERFTDELTPAVRPDNCINRAKEAITDRHNGLAVDSLAGTLW